SHSARNPSMIRFSAAAARRAIHPVLRRVERCRRGHFWGNGYATIIFWNDGSVRQVLVDPPFSMTVAGKCVADALHGSHMPSFMGRTGYYRLRFYIAPRLGLAATRLVAPATPQGSANNPNPGMANTSSAQSPKPTTAPQW